MINLDLTFHVWSIVATLIITVFYLGPVTYGFKWLRSKTRKTDSM